MTPVSCLALPRRPLIVVLALLLGLAADLVHGEQIDISGYRFNPDEVAVPVGEAVVWRNGDRARHNIVIGKTQSPALQQGQSFTFTPPGPGEYVYHCSFHSGMKGSLIVGNGASSEDVRSAVSANRVLPALREATPGTAGPLNSPSEEGPASTKKVVEIVDFMRFDPGAVEIQAGETVTWVNHDGSNHKIQFADSTSPRLRHDASYTKRFDSPGSYDYKCAIHGDKMSGKVLVK